MQRQVLPYNLKQKGELAEVEENTVFVVHTSRISLILHPPFPISEPHWLAGTTMRRVTGGLLVAVLFVIELLIS